MIRDRPTICKLVVVAVSATVLVLNALTSCGLVPVRTFAQTSAAVELGSRTAKGGFKNEDEIRDKFNNWRNDADARAWLTAMKYDVAAIESVVATKPHGEKADVEVRVKTKSGERREGISIKLVSSPTGFNQIDKRWLAAYAKKWRMSAEVHAALKLFVGETPPSRSASGSSTQAAGVRSDTRMFLNELDAASQKAVIDFFTLNKAEIVSDIFAGDGAHSAGWFMVAYKATANTRWILTTDAEAAKFFSEGKVEITRRGNLKIGRITVQRKGGDGGRETAKMLQFKINPALLISN